MSRSQVIVNVTAAIPRRGADSVTGTAFLLYAGAAGTPTPVVCDSVADATATSAPAQIVQWVGDMLTQGAPRVVLLRATAADPANVTQPEWTAALGLLTDEFGPGQVTIPGVSTAAAYAALLDHANTANRCALLDSISSPVVATLVTTAAGLAASPGSQRSTIVTHATLSGPAGTTRDVPGSVVVAGLVARNDAYNGHANNAPIRDQSRGAGYVIGATDVPKRFSNAELDSLKAAGVSAIEVIGGQVQLGEWRSLSTDPNFRQLNWGRMAMQLATGVGGGMAQFIGRQIDGKGNLYAEAKATLISYLTPLWQAGALFGGQAADAFDVVVDASNNTPTTVAAGELHADVAVSLSPSTETVIVNVTTTIAEGIAA